MYKNFHTTHNFSAEGDVFPPDEIDPPRDVPVLFTNMDSLNSVLKKKICWRTDVYVSIVYIRESLHVLTKLVHTSEVANHCSAISEDNQQPFCSLQFGW